MTRASSLMFSYLPITGATVLLALSCDEYTCQDLANCEFDADAATSADLDERTSNETVGTESAAPPGSLVSSGAASTSVELGTEGTIGDASGQGEPVDTSSATSTEVPGQTSDTSSPTCNQSQQQCGGVCIGSSECCTSDDCPDGATCDLGVCHCPVGTHPCGGECVSDVSPQTCGQACSPCQEPTGGTATCDGTSCGALCPDGEQLCAGECIEDSRSCTGTCPNGSHDCSGLCASNEDVTSCGSSCNPCPVPANATATCNGDVCGFACESGFKPCGDGCIHVDSCCEDAECDDYEECSEAHACECEDGYKSCESTCISNDACCSNDDCDSVPTASCVDDTTLRTFFSTGNCLGTHACEYPHTDTTCSLGCDDGACTTLQPIQVTVGAMHACALMTDGTVYCWGEGGRLGNGSQNQSLAPVKVSGINNAVQITTGGGNTTCARLVDQTIKCWGEQAYGQTGQGKLTSYALSPTTVPGVTGVADVQASGTSNVVCAALSNGTVRCWGADADFVDILTPTTVVGLTGVRKLGTGSAASCAVLDNQTVRCWTGADGTPSTVSGVTSVDEMSGHCARSGGTIKCWGPGNYGQIGNGSTDDQTSPTQVQQLDPATAMASGDSHVCAIVEDGAVYCWGRDGNFGPNNYGALPLRIIGLEPVQYLATADSSNCVIQQDHAVMCWGFNAKGQLGNGNTTSSATPVAVVGLPTDD